MAQVEKLAPHILKWEGGFQNDPVDKGNYHKGVLIGTNKGVTPSTYLQAFGKVPTEQDMRNLTEEQFMHVLKLLYWNRWRADEIESQPVANILVGWVWGSGKWGVIIPQRVLEVPDDGVVGNITLNAVNNSNPKELFERLKAAKRKYLQGIVDASISAYEDRIGRKASQKEIMLYTKAKYLRGWLNRLHSYTY